MIAPPYFHTERRKKKKETTSKKKKRMLPIHSIHVSLSIEDCFFFFSLFFSSGMHFFEMPSMFIVSWRNSLATLPHDVQYASCPSRECGAKKTQFPPDPTQSTSPSML